MVLIQELEHGTSTVPTCPLLELAVHEIVQVVVARLDAAASEAQTPEAAAAALLEELSAVLSAAGSALDEAENSLKHGGQSIDVANFSKCVRDVAERSGAVQEAATKVAGGAVRSASRDRGLAERAFNCRRRALRLLELAPAIAGPRCAGAALAAGNADGQASVGGANGPDPAAAIAEEGHPCDDLEARRAEIWAGVTHLDGALLEVSSRLLENNGQGRDALVVHKLVREIAQNCDTLQRRAERLAAERFAASKRQAADGRPRERRTGRAPGAKTGGGSEWSLTHTFRVGTRGSEQDFAGKTTLLEASSCSSVTQACEGLNRGTLPCPDGVCVVYSAQAKAYYALYRKGCRDLAHARLQALPEPACPRAPLELTTLNARLKETRRGAERLLEALKRGTDEPAMGWFHLPGCCTARAAPRR